MKIRSGMASEHAKHVEINSHDGYSKATVEYETRWAEEMERRMASGGVIAGIADDASSVADTDGITGFMYACAVHDLARFWEYGDTLLTWHNRQYIGDEAKADAASKEGRCVNPAVLTIGE